MGSQTECCEDQGMMQPQLPREGSPCANASPYAEREGKGTGQHLVRTEFWAGTVLGDCPIPQTLIPHGNWRKKDYYHSQLHSYKAFQVRTNTYTQKNT